MIVHSSKSCWGYHYFTLLNSACVSYLFLNIISHCSLLLYMFTHISNFAQLIFRNVFMKQSCHLCKGGISYMSSRTYHLWYITHFQMRRNLCVESTILLLCYEWKILRIIGKSMCIKMIYQIDKRYKGCFIIDLSNIF